jgi:hypothetical protein
LFRDLVSPPFHAAGHFVVRPAGHAEPGANRAGCAKSSGFSEDLGEPVSEAAITQLVPARLSGFQALAPQRFGGDAFAPSGFRLIDETIDIGWIKSSGFLGVLWGGHFPSLA